MATEDAQHIPKDVDMPDQPESTEVGATSAPNGKRKAETELDRAAKKTPSESPAATVDDASATHNDGADGSASKPLSKNQLKKLRRQQQWEEFKEDRRAKRKDKRHERQARKRAEKEAKIGEAEAAGLDPATVLQQQKEPWKYRPVPVSFIIDCDFEQYMREQELVSLSSQIVRSYAMNRKARYHASLHLSSWKGKLRERFETVLKNAHLNWKNVGFHEGDFREAAKKAQEQMAGPQGGEVIDLIKPGTGEEAQSSGAGGPAGTTPTLEAEPEDQDVDRSIVYLTSESPYTLERLEANTSYVIGGIVDRNREKGLCYRRAREYKVQTAKLPIGEYMAMQSRYVLTTNQVVEIMAKWLECGDWGKAFLDVIPKRKGGTLKGEGAEGSVKNGDDEEQEDEGTEEGAAEIKTLDESRATSKQPEPVAQQQETLQ